MTELLVPCSCDLILAMDTSSKPTLFAHKHIPWPLIFSTKCRAISDKDLPVSQSERLLNSNTYPLGLDKDLAAAWAAMSHFCAQLNQARENKGAKVTTAAFLHSMGAIMYRLLHQRYHPGSRNEVFRIGLLAFSTPIFLHWNRVELPDPHFTATFRKVLIQYELTKQTLGKQEQLWLLMVAALSMSHEPGSVTWLKPKLKASARWCKVFTWDCLRTILDSILWVPEPYDSAGKDIFESIVPDGEDE